MPPPHATIAIISPGDMGSAIAKLLIAHNYRVITNVSDRSPTTHSRALSAGIELLSSDKETVSQADYILSIVPPRDAVRIAERFVGVVKAMNREKEVNREEEMERERGEERELWYVDLNAISPGTARGIGGLWEGMGTGTGVRVKFVDGGVGLFFFFVFFAGIGGCG